MLRSRRRKNPLVKYEGSVQHIFFHSLIIYPELAFDEKGQPAQGYNMWMVTVGEFKKMLPKLEKKGYVLYPLTEYIQQDPENPGNIKLKDIYLPPGKIPLVISIDDVSYYDYMKSDGFANRLVMGEDSRVWTEVITPEGKTVLTRDGDVMPILDDYRITVNSDNIMMPRIDIDGYSMNKRAEELNRYYFNVSEVLDPIRPALSVK